MEKPERQTLRSYLTLEEACAFANRSYSSIKKWVAAGKVRVKKDKGKTKFRREDIQAILAGQGGKMKKGLKDVGEPVTDGGSGVSEYEPPSWLTPSAAEIFRTLYSQIKDYGVIQPADVGGLAMCAKYLAEFQLCESELHKKKTEDDSGLIQIDKNKDVRINPITRHQRFCAEMFFQYSARYGLTPSDREALKISVKKPQGESGESVR